MQYFLFCSVLLLNVHCTYVCRVQWSRAAGYCARYEYEMLYIQYTDSMNEPAELWPLGSIDRVNEYWAPLLTEDGTRLSCQAGQPAVHGVNQICKKYITYLVWQPGFRSSRLTGFVSWIRLRTRFQLRIRIRLQRTIIFRFSELLTNLWKKL